MEEDSICGVSWQSSKNPGEMDQQMWALELGLCSLCCRSPCNSICRKKKSVKKKLMDTTGGGNQSPSGIKSGEGHEGQQVFCRNASSKRQSEEMWGCCSAGWEFWWQRTWKLPKNSSFKSLLVKPAFRNSSFLHQSEEYLSQGRKIQSGNAKKKQSYGMHG